MALKANHFHGNSSKTDRGNVHECRLVSIHRLEVDIKCFCMIENFNLIVFLEETPEDFHSNKYHHGIVNAEVLLPYFMATHPLV